MKTKAECGFRVTTNGKAFRVEYLVLRASGFLGLGIKHSWHPLDDSVLYKMAGDIKNSFVKREDAMEAMSKCVDYSCGPWLPVK